jgi:multidrug efflux pump
LGIVIAGGLVFAGILTLFIIPAVYSYFSSAKTKTKVEENNSDGRYSKTKLPDINKKV